MALRIHPALMFLASGALLLTSLNVRSAKLTCSDNSFYLPEAEITRSEGEDYVRHEFLYEQDDAYWIGVVFEFQHSALEYGRLSENRRTDQGGALSAKLADITQRNMLEAGIYERVTKAQAHESDQGVILTFDAAFQEHKALYAVYGRWDGAKLEFFRIHTEANDSVNKATQAETAAQSLSDIVKNCSLNEA